MKHLALSLWQPHASLIAEGVKLIETRSKKINLRGDVLICSAQRLDASVREEIKAYKNLGLLEPSFNLSNAFGKAIAMVEIYDCVPMTEELRKDAALLETHAIEGKWGYLLRNIRPVRGVYAVKGGRGFFYVDSEDICRMPNIPLYSAYTEGDLQRIGAFRKARLR